MPEEVHWLSDDEQRAWRAQFRMFLMLNRQLERDLQPFGLAQNDYEILVELSEAPLHRMRMTDLADATCQSRSRLSHQITRMESRGLVTRAASEGDKRGMFAVLTPEGLTAIERAAPSHVESVRRHFMDRLTPDQLEVIRIAYEPIYHYLRTIRIRDLGLPGPCARPLCPSPVRRDLRAPTGRARARRRPAPKPLRARARHFMTSLLACLDPRAPMSQRRHLSSPAGHRRHC